MATSVACGIPLALTKIGHRPRMLLGSSTTSGTTDRALFHKLRSNTPPSAGFAKVHGGTTGAHEDYPGARANSLNLPIQPVGIRAFWAWRRGGGGCRERFSHC
ncbi:MAG: hypothetical protein WCP77_12180 [Roseococcus sp.]